MFSVSLGILLAGSIALQLEETKAVSSADTEAIVKNLSGALEKQTGDQLIINSLKPNSACRSSDKCIGKILRKQQATEVVFVTIEKTPAAFKIKLMRTSGGGLTPNSAKVDLPHPRATWGAFLTGAAIMLFPEGANLTPPIVAAARPKSSQNKPSVMPTIEIRKTLAVKKPAPKPKPVAAKPIPKPQPKPVAAKPIPKPQPKPVAAKPIPKPQPKPVAAKPKPKPQPVAAKPKPKPQPIAAKPKPKPQPIAAKPKPKPQPIAAKPKFLIPPVAKRKTTKQKTKNSRPTLIAPRPTLVAITQKARKTPKKAVTKVSKVKIKKKTSKSARSKKVRLARIKAKPTPKKSANKMPTPLAAVSTSEMIARAQAGGAPTKVNPAPSLPLPPSASETIDAATALPGLSIITPEQVDNTPWPWLVLSAGILSAGVGTYFGIHNQSLIAEGEVERDPAIRAGYQERVQQAGITANVLFGTAALSAITSAVLFAIN